jgi:hypothetical protein
MIESSELINALPRLRAVLKDFAKACRKKSPGGKKITKEEWEQIGIDAGILAKEVVLDALD